MNNGIRIANKTSQGSWAKRGNQGINFFEKVNTPFRVFLGLLEPFLRDKGQKSDKDQKIKSAAPLPRSNPSRLFIGIKPH
jgi:hypothetical protein